MADSSPIEWTRGEDGTPGATWNPVTGCTKVSPGCDHCYAETFAERWRGTPGHHFENGFDLTFRPERLGQPLRWARPRRIFVNSMSDLFHDGIPDGFIARVFAVMLAAPQHTFQVLTKRHARMRSLLSRPGFADEVFARAVGECGMVPERDASRWWPIPNVWLGVSVEDQKWADIRIPALLDTPATVRWISAEPLLGPLNLSRYVWDEASGLPGDWDRGLDWVVLGGESGPGARPMHTRWAREVRDQCVEARVPFFFKQHGDFLTATVEDDPAYACGRAFNNPASGGRSAAVVHERGRSGTFRNGFWRSMRSGDRTKGAVMLDEDTIAVRVGKKAAGRLLDGRTWDEFPQPAEVRHG